MKKVFIWMVLGAWLVGMGLAGCGQTGPLYLPKSTQSSSGAVTKKTEVKSQSSSSAASSSFISSFNNPNPIAPPTALLAPATKSIAGPAPATKPTH